MQFKTHKFSFVEFTIVITVILIVVSLINPSFKNLIQNARDTQCLSHQQKIHIGIQLYAEDSNNIIIPVRARRVQINIGASNLEAMPLANIAEKKEGKWKPLENWNCPSRDYQSQQEGSHFVLAYQYFGGIQQWNNPWGRFNAKSPSNLNYSKPNWVLAADTTAKINGDWGKGRESSYANMPSHQLKSSKYPSGSNQVYVDGSAEWVDFADLLFIHTWSIDRSRDFYMYQKDLGNYDPPKEASAKYE